MSIHVTAEAITKDAASNETNGAVEEIVEVKSEDTQTRFKEKNKTPKKIMQFHEKRSPYDTDMAEAFKRAGVVTEEMLREKEKEEREKASEESTTLECIECKTKFSLTKKEKQWFEERNLVPPKRCPECRRRIREARQAAASAAEK